MSELPAIKYLDKAAKLANESGWREIDDCIAIGELSASIIAHARTLEALAKYEPEPVDPDWAVVERILNAANGMPLGTPWSVCSQTLKRALAQYKAERPTITDDDALLIAREICARVADGIFHVENYRDGSYDGCPELQFALAMVKRDPAALEAFRGVAK